MAKQSERNGRRDRHGNRRAGADCRCGRCRKRWLEGVPEVLTKKTPKDWRKDWRSRSLNPLYAVRIK